MVLHQDMFFLSYTDYKLKLRALNDPWEMWSSALHFSMITNSLLLRRRIPRVKDRCIIRFSTGNATVLLYQATCGKSYLPFVSFQQDHLIADMNEWIEKPLWIFPLTWCPIIGLKIGGKMTSNHHHSYPDSSSL